MKEIKDDIELILNLKNGDAHSLEVIFRRLYLPLCSFANKFLNNFDDSEEVVQDIFYKIWKNRETLDETQSLKAYLFTSTRNSCLSTLKHNKVKDKYATLLERIYCTPHQESSSHEYLIAGELEKDFSKALEKLPPECRKVFELSRLEGLKHREIAEQLNISVKTVETQMSRALCKIKVQLKDYLLAIILLTLFE